MSLLRVLTSAQVTISHTFYVDETPTDAAGSVTVTVKRLDGTTVATAAAAHPGAMGVYTYALPAQANVDTLTVDWTGTVAGAAVTARDHVEVVGGYLFGLAEARALPPALDATAYPTATLAAARTLVEQKAERIAGRAFVPRFARREVSVRNGVAVLPNIDVRAIRSVRIGSGNPTAPLTYEAYTTYGWEGGPRGMLVTGFNDYAVSAIVEYEHGMDYPPEDVRRAAMHHLRAELSSGNNGIPARATSFTVTDGGVYRLATPGERATGIPEVDAVYQAYRVDVWGFA